ncbi:hypothetical protein [Mycobacterium sp. DBP42]|uniref:hypothetical protein n=1 Tax=Mycobacterium sp. DBP42 TaxID=2545267 RepID=UPI001485E244|nr:hypothetical protein [Mycobacterium sp. DBP42]
MTIAQDVQAERAAFADTLMAVGPSASTGCVVVSGLRSILRPTWWAKNATVV